MFSCFHNLCAIDRCWVSNLAPRMRKGYPQCRGNMCNTQTLCKAVVEGFDSDVVLQWTPRVEPGETHLLLVCIVFQTYPNQQPTSQVTHHRLKTRSKVNISMIKLEHITVWVVTISSSVHWIFKFGHRMLNLSCLVMNKEGSSGFDMLLDIRKYSRRTLLMARVTRFR